MSATFDTDNSGFTYQDDAFRGTANPVYAAGDFDAAGGHSGGGLHVAIGGVDEDDITNGMSGGWSQNFVVNGDDTVTVTLWYRLVFFGNYEPDECGQALVAIDGQLLDSGSQDYLYQFCGFGDGNPTQDTGWQQATLQVPLTDGTHTITIGGWNNKKTATVEATDLYFDEIEITQQDQTQTTNEMVVTETGNVGIGTTEPDSKLEIAGYSPTSTPGPTILKLTPHFGFRQDSNTYQNLVLDYYNSGWQPQMTFERLKGNVGIGTTEPASKLEIAGYSPTSTPGPTILKLTSHFGFRQDSNTYKNLVLDYYNSGWHPQVSFERLNGYVGIGTTDPQDKLDVAGYVRSNGVRLTSDARWKENVEDIDNALLKISQLRGVNYDWIDKSRGDGPQLGVIAQEVEEVFPEVVHTDSQGYKSVEYSKLVAPLIEAIKELNQRNKVLQTENVQLKQDMVDLRNEIEQRLATMEAVMSNRN